MSTPLASSLIPTINVGPFVGYSLRQRFPLASLAARVAPGEGHVFLERRLIAGGQSETVASTALPGDPKDWREDAVPDLTLDSAAGDAPERFVETHVYCEGDVAFTSPYPPSFYTVYAHAVQKPFYSDGALKVANPYVINQIAEFGQWCETYPGLRVSARASATAILINPYPLPTVVSLSRSGGSKRLRRKIAPLSTEHVELSALLEEGEQSCDATLYVWAKNRVVLFVAFHGRDVGCIASVEHSEVYRGAAATQSLTRKAQAWLRRRTGRLFDKRSLHEVVQDRESTRRIPVNR